jgi:hypothetical protein
MPRLDATLSPATPAVIRCRIAAHAAVRAAPNALAQWRRQPPPLTGQPLPTSFFRHSDDQTVATVAVVHAALVRQGWLGHSFADWGAIAAPNFFGRSGTAHSVPRYVKEGAWGVSPHVIPHQSLHAVSGTISQLLKMHGPNFGISGGPRACNDAFLIAGAMLAEGCVSGLWLLLSGHEREWVPVEDGQVSDSPPPLCEAVALALTPAADADDGLFLRIGSDVDRAELGDFTLSALVAALTAADGPAEGAWSVPGTGWFELEVVSQTAGSRR